MDLTFEEFWEDLNNGFGFSYYHLGNKFSIHKMSKNSYCQKLLIQNSKTPQPENLVLTLKGLKEIFPYLIDIEYNVNIDILTK